MWTHRCTLWSLLQPMWASVTTCLQVTLFTQQHFNLGLLVYSLGHSQQFRQCLFEPAAIHMQWCSQNLAENALPSFYYGDIFVLIIVLYCIMISHCKSLRSSPNMCHLFSNCTIFGSSTWSIEQSLCTGSNTEGGGVKVDPHPSQYSKWPVNVGGSLEVLVEWRYLGCCNHDLLIVISTHLE